jgi:hypothetical protein
MRIIQENFGPEIDLDVLDIIDSKTDTGSSLRNWFVDSSVPHLTEEILEEVSGRISRALLTEILRKFLQYGMVKRSPERVHGT